MAYGRLLRRRTPPCRLTVSAFWTRPGPLRAADSASTPISAQTIIIRRRKRRIHGSRPRSFSPRGDVQRYLQDPRRSSALRRCRFARCVDLRDAFQPYNFVPLTRRTSVARTRDAAQDAAVLNGQLGDARAIRARSRSRGIPPRSCLTPAGAPRRRPCARRSSIARHIVGSRTRGSGSSSGRTRGRLRGRSGRTSTQSKSSTCDRSTGRCRTKSSSSC